MEKLFYRPEECAELLGVGRELIYRYLRSGDLRRTRIGTRTRIAAVDLEAFCERLRSEDVSVPRQYGRPGRRHGRRATSPAPDSGAA